MLRRFCFLLFPLFAFVTYVEPVLAGPLWFSGYINPANDYRYYATTDWDSPLYNVGIQPDTDLYGITPPSRRVDGHMILEADGTGFAKVIESTGSLATWAHIGDVFSVTWQFTNWWSNPGYQATSDTRHDWNADFLNIVSDPVVQASVPEPESYTLVFAGLGLLGLFGRRSKRKAP